MAIAPDGGGRRPPCGYGSFKQPAPRNFDCEVYFDKFSRWTWPLFCSVMIHEYGHLLGHHHSRDRANVMHSRSIPYVPMCGTRP